MSVTNFFLILGAVLAALAGLVALVLRPLMRNRKMQSDMMERIAREREAVARVEERGAAVRREHERQPAIDPRKRTDFEA